MSGYIDERSGINGLRLTILHDYTKEDQRGWTFCFNSESYSLHGRERDMLLGNLPFLVDRHTGEVRVIPLQSAGYTAEEIDERIAQHAKRPFVEKETSMTSRARSAIVVTVKPTLLSWMKNNGAQRPYFPEEDAVWVIPAVSSFSDAGAFELYVDALRPRILDAELERFGRGLRERILADHALEDLIGLTVRDEVVFADGDE